MIVSAIISQFNKKALFFCHGAKLYFDFTIYDLKAMFLTLNPNFGLNNFIFVVHKICRG